MVLPRGRGEEGLPHLKGGRKGIGALIMGLRSAQCPVDATFTEPVRQYFQEIVLPHPPVNNPLTPTPPLFRSTPLQMDYHGWCTRNYGPWTVKHLTALQNTPCHLSADWGYAICDNLIPDLVYARLRFEGLWCVLRVQGGCYLDAPPPLCVLRILLIWVKGRCSTCCLCNF